MGNDNYVVFDQMIEGIQIIDRDMKYIYINNSAAIHGKFSKEELTGSFMQDKYPGIQNTKMFESIKNCMQDRLPTELVNEFVYNNGSKSFFELRMQPVNDGVLIMSIDITNQKLAENYLLNQKIILEEEIKIRTSELEIKNKELEQFAFIASHDLQEPLRTISNYILVLKEDFNSSLNHVALGYLDSMAKANTRMISRINAMLDFALYGQNKKLTKIDLSDLIKTVQEDLKSLINSSQAKISVFSMPILDVYEEELRQVFQNLISNAIKFRKKNSIPEIKITSEKSDGKWIFAIEDNGIGIEKEYFERIFMLFQRLNSSTLYEGMGIGLANCKKIIEMHHGSISVESEPGIGSKFIFSISEL